MEETVQIWLFNTNDKNKLAGTIRVPSGQELQPGQTAIRPADGLYGTPMYDTENQRWFGEDKEQWLKEHPIPVPKPDPEQIALAGVMKSLADVKTDGQSQDKLNASVMKQVAQLTIQNTTQAKLNANVMKQMAQMKISTDTKLKEQEQVNANAMKEIAMLKISLAKAAQPTQPTESTQPTEPAKPSEPTAPAQPTEVTQPTDIKEEA